MSVSIYDFVKKKLISHGVEQTPDGLLTLETKVLFLAFVQLERAVRIADFDAVQDAVRKIETRVKSMGKRHLIVFAYMYLQFSDGTPKVTHADVIQEDGRVLRSVEYLRPVTGAERLIADWGDLLYQRYGEYLLRAVSASKK
jgi:hypothetical protein